MSDTPRTDKVYSFSNLSPGEEVSRAFARQLERELNESYAREAQLRAALQALYDLGSLELPQRRDPALRAAFNALSLPPPPVVPVEDVKPLLEVIKALQWAAQDDEHGGNYATSALSTFTAKHPNL